MLGFNIHSGTNPACDQDTGTAFDPGPGNDPGGPGGLDPEFYDPRYWDDDQEDVREDFGGGTPRDHGNRRPRFLSFSNGDTQPFLKIGCVSLVTNLLN